MFHRLLILCSVFTLSTAMASDPTLPEDCNDNVKTFGEKLADKLNNLPCGLLGSVDQRIDDCSAKGAKSKNGFVLVTRTREGKEVYQDEKSGLLWGDLLRFKMTHAQALKACEEILAEVGRIASRKWRLPTVEEVKTAKKNGLNNQIPHMDHWQWTSSTSSTSPKFRSLYSNSSTMMAEKPTERYNVRCVGSNQ